MGMIAHSSGAAARGVPVFLPTLQANADVKTFVLNVAGGAGANETGAGLGLSGPDLVITQVNNVPGVVSGHRALTAGSGHHFTGTAAWAAAWLNNPEWTYAIEFTDWVQASTKDFWHFAGAAGTFLAESLASYGVTITTPSGYPATYGAMPATSSKTWLCAWRKNSIIHVGWKVSDAIPWGWDDFPAAQRGLQYHPQDYSGAWSTIIAASAAAYPNTFKLGTIVASKLGLQAAPLNL